MKKYRKGFYGILLLTLTMLFGMTAQAKTDDTIKTGIYAGDVELSGMTAQEATAVGCDLEESGAGAGSIGTGDTWKCH